MKERRVNSEKFRMKNKELIVKTPFMKSRYVIFELSTLNFELNFLAIYKDGIDGRLAKVVGHKRQAWNFFGD